MGEAGAQRTAPKWRPWPAALAVSLSLHLWLALTSEHVAQPHPQPPVAEFVTFELAAWPVADAASAEAPAPAHQMRIASPTAEASVPLRAPQSASSSAVRDEASTSALSSTSTGTVDGSAIEPVPGNVSPAISAELAISPRDAARTVVPLPTPEREAIAAGAALSDYLQTFASARPHLDRRAPPVLKPLPEGGYAYVGPGFAARVHRDGSVQFIDRVVHPDGSFSFPNDPAKVGVLFTPFRFDLTDAMLRAMGEQLYPAEKRWFLEQTQTLREQLEADDRLLLFARARRQLRDTLMNIVNDAQMTSHQKRDAVFALWADCSDDEVGARGRHVIEQFVRDHLPESSPNAFTAGELDRLNQRNAHRRFDPYAPAKPASEP